jgi:hypothetical protein
MSWAEWVLATYDENVVLIAVAISSARAAAPGTDWQAAVLAACETWAPFIDRGLSIERWKQQLHEALG